MENIKDLIYEIRGKQVMLDSDAAMLYKYETKVINQTVKRNIERFPEDFCFHLTEVEYANLRSQFVTSNSNEIDNMRCHFGTASNKIDEQKGIILRSQNVTLDRDISTLKKDINNLRRQNGTLNKNENKSGKHRKYLPYVFTEQGIAMLSGLLKNETAIKVSINIMNAFVEMRKFISSNHHMFERLTTIEYKLLDYDEKFDLLFDELGSNKDFKQKIFYDGQIYDAYSLIIDIIKKAEKEIVVIDNYVNKDVFDMLSNKKNGVKVTIISSNELNDLDINKFNEQYPLLEVIKSNKYHDRFIVIDSIEIYHLGASFKDAGKKCFAINKMEDNTVIKSIIKTN